MSFSQFLGVLKARLWVVLLALVLTVGVAVALSLLLPKQYSAETNLVIDFKGTDPVMGMMLPLQMMPGYMATQVDIIQSKKVAKEVVKGLKLAEAPGARDQWMDETEGRGSIEDFYADLLLKKLDVQPARESSMITIKFSGSEPRFAAAIANAFALAYQRTNLELRVEPARQSALWFDDQLQSLRKNLEAAQTRMSEYQREKGFTAADERLDMEAGRLQELSGQYTAAQAQAADASSKLRQLTDFINRGANPETLPDILANPLVQNLKVQLQQTESRLEQTSSQLGKNHPEVSRLEADLVSQRAKLRAEINVAAASIRNTANIASRREGELRNAMAEQKTRLLKLNQGRDEFQVLMKEVDNAQKAFDLASQRFQQTNLESQASLTNISVLSAAVPPVKESFPILWLNVLLGVILGSMLGIGLALIAEMLDRRVRSTEDLVTATGVPILGALLNDRPERSKLRKWRSKAPKKIKLAAPALT